MLVELQLPGDVAGSVTAEAAAATGIPAGLPVVTTANDKAVEALGSGSLGETTALVSLGTYIAAMVHGRENRKTRTPSGRTSPAFPHRYLYESARRAPRDVDAQLVPRPPRRGGRRAGGVARALARELLEREAETVPAGSDGLMTVLDWLAPTDRPFRKGVMLGFDARHTRGHVYRSILEAIALTMKAQRGRDVRRSSASTLDEIVVSGGGASSPLFMQIFADVFGIPASRCIGGGGGAGLGVGDLRGRGDGQCTPTSRPPCSAMTGGRESFAPTRRAPTSTGG